jgi:hypothetical protein
MLIVDFVYFCNARAADFWQLVGPLNNLFMTVGYHTSIHLNFFYRNYKTR